MDSLVLPFQLNKTPECGLDFYKMKIGYKYIKYVTELQTLFLRDLSCLSGPFKGLTSKHTWTPSTHLSFHTYITE